jgi:hypothetical protein
MRCEWARPCHDQTSWPDFLRVPLSVRDFGLPSAFHTFGRKFVIGCEGVGIHHGKAENEDDDLPCAEHDLHWPWISRYMGRFPVAYGAIVTIFFF